MTSLARHTDPAASHVAGAAVKNAKLTHGLVIAALLKSNPGSTYQELFARHVAIQARKLQAPILRDAPSLMKRLRSVAKRTGERECRITGRCSSTWVLQDGDGVTQ